MQYPHDKEHHLLLVIHIIEIGGLETVINTQVLAHPADFGLHLQAQRQQPHRL